MKDLGNIVCFMTLLVIFSLEIYILLIHTEYLQKTIGPAFSGERTQIHFATYGNERFTKSLKRIKLEAIEMNMFHKMWIQTENQLQKDKEFWSQHGTFMKKYKRGNGYWIWKSYIIKKIMEKTHSGSVIVYCDAGCTLNPNQRRKLLNWISLAQNNEGKQVGFDGSDIERRRTKKDLLHKLGFVALENMKSNQLSASVFIIINTPSNRNLVNQWYELSTCDEYHYVDDSPSILPNSPYYIEHRHDQSIWSILRKQKRPKICILPQLSTKISNAQYPILKTRRRE